MRTNAHCNAENFTNTKLLFIIMLSHVDVIRINGSTLQLGDIHSTQNKECQNQSCILLIWPQRLNDGTWVAIECNDAMPILSSLWFYRVIILPFRIKSTHTLRIVYSKYMMDLRACSETHPFLFGQINFGSSQTGISSI